MENGNKDAIIDELNSKIRKNMRMNNICSNLTFTASILTMGAAGYFIKTPGYPGAFAVTGTSLAGTGIWFGIGHMLNKKIDNSTKKYINVLHGYALEDNKVYGKKESIKK